MHDKLKANGLKFGQAGECQNAPQQGGMVAAFATGPVISWTGSIIMSCTFGLIGLVSPRKGSGIDLLHCINVFMAWH